MNPLTILIIDDEETQLISLKSFLKRRGYEIFTATSGPAAFEIAQNNTIDLVLTDYRMPEWNGFEVLKDIAEKEEDDGADRPFPGKIIKDHFNQHSFSP